MVKDAIPRKQGNNPHCEESKKREFFRGGSRLTKCRKYSKIRRLIGGTMPQENSSDPIVFNARVSRLYAISGVCNCVIHAWDQSLVQTRLTVFLPQGVMIE